MTPSSPHIILLGRFPPPRDGQSVATLRLADQLDGPFEVHRLNSMIPAEAHRFAKLNHYRAIGKDLENVLTTFPDAPVIWTSISPEPSGHWRDLLTVFPRLRNRTVIAVAHWGKFASVFRNPWTRISARRLLPSLDCVVFTAPVLSAACSEWLPSSRRAVIANTLDSALIPEAHVVEERIEQGPGSPLKVLFLSNMIREKGWDDVLDAASMLKQNDLAYEWIFAGGWPQADEERRFQRRVDELGLTDVASHLGPLTSASEIAALHLEADVLVLPSWLREAQPLTIIEAMAAGTPCLVTHDGGMPDMIGAGSANPAGVTIPSRDPEALVHALQSLVQADTWTAHARAARERFETMFSPRIVEQHWRDLIDRVTQSGSSS